MMLQKTETLLNSRHLVQCTIVGDELIGKTCLSRAFASLPENEDYVPTVFENYAGRINVNGDDYTISIFDTPGKRDYDSLRRFTYEDSEVLLVCFSVVDRESFNNVTDFWVPEIKNNTQRKKPIVLVASQTDLLNTTSYDSDMPVSRKEIAKLASDIGASCYVECSSTEISSVKKVFTEVVNASLKNRKRRSNIIYRLLSK